MFSPRLWQQAAKQAYLSFQAGRPKKGGLVVATTGSGKTKMAHYILIDALNAGRRVLWIADQEELIEQPLASLRENWPHIQGGIVQQKRNAVDAQIVYASKQTLLRPGRLDQILAHGVPHTIVVDECHQSVSAAYERLLRPLRDLGCEFLGLTATPEREDTRNLSEHWEIVHQYPLLQAIEEGTIVAPYQAKALVPGLDLGRVKIARGDYSSPELERELMRNHIVEHTVLALTRPHHAERLPFHDHAMVYDPRGKATLVHTVTVLQAEATAKALEEVGIVARVIHAKVPKATRRRLLRGFLDGKIQVLVSPAALAQGVDLPIAEVDVLARPTRSRRLYIQIVGRVLRPARQKTAGLILDLCGATDLHSLISAPVLIDGTDCDSEASQDGRHIYIEVEEGAGMCHHCAKKIKCYRNKGGHVFKHGICKLCGATQCPNSSSHMHEFIPWEGKLRCVHCGVEIRDPLSGMIRAKYPPKEKVAWQLLQKIPGHVWAVDLGRPGILFNVIGSQGHRPYLVARNQVSPLSAFPVPPELARMLTDDVARQAKKTGGYYGGFVSTAARGIRAVQLDHVARQYRIWEL